MSRTARLTRSFIALVIGFSLASACGDDETKETGKRGLGGKKETKEDKEIAARRKALQGGAPVEAEPVDDRPKRPRPQLTRDDFNSSSRDPFQSFVGPAPTVEVQQDRPRAQREVEFAEHEFEDLTLIAIVHSGRRVVPRALFLASDGKSKTIKQGEYFSRAEVLLASVNRDYVEIEVVDEDLASNLNLARGERRAIYLKTN